MRLFIAVTFDESVTRYLDQLANRLYALGGRRTARSNLHLTLAFLGELTEENLPALHRAMDELEDHAFDISTGKPGSFIRPQGNIYYLDMQPHKPLQTLHDGLVKALQDENIPLADTGFTPHVTLLRTGKGKSVPLDELQPLLKTHTCRIAKLTLMHSHRVNDVLTYTPIYTTNLREKD